MTNTNNSISLVSLDFDTNKASLINYYKTQTIFKDYNFVGSNINILVDELSYNTYSNAFYLNMVASEMFMDSAQKYDSVVSHAKELNYLPQSVKSSAANISFTFQTNGISGPFTIPRGALFYGVNSNGSFMFTTSEEKTITSGNTIYSVDTLSIHEGTFLTDSFVIDYEKETQIFTLANKNIDISSLRVNVIEDGGASNTLFLKTDNLYGLNENSNVYFLQAAQDYRYDVVFGDGILGRYPKNGAIVLANYRFSTGPNADGIDTFSVAEDLGRYNGGTTSNVVVTTLESSSSGGLAEDIDTIKFRAPRYFAAQQRAVTSDDYISLILTNFGNEITDVIIYGGQELEPKLYGRVVVSLISTGSITVPNYL